MKRVLSVGLVTAVACFAQAQHPPSIRATGEASLSVAPDRVELAFTVATDGKSAQKASADNAEVSARVMSALRSTVGSSGTVKTSNYSLTPDVDYTGKPKVVGYHANNSVRVVLDEVGKAGSVIDAALNAGANNVDGISFTLRDDAPTRAQVLAMAAEKAKSNAAAIAKGLGVRLTGVLEAATSDAPIPRPMPMAARAMMKEATPTTIEAGSLDVHATVSVTMGIE